MSRTAKVTCTVEVEAILYDAHEYDGPNAERSDLWKEISGNLNGAELLSIDSYTITEEAS